jgi:hypothetical protein
VNKFVIYMQQSENYCAFSAKFLCNNSVLGLEYFFNFIMRG